MESGKGKCLGMLDATTSSLNVAALKSNHLLVFLIIDLDLL